MRNMKRPASGSPFGVWNDTSKGWCFVAHDDSDGGAFRGTMIECERELDSFRKTYPDSRYRLAKHSDECSGWFINGNCCKPSDLQEDCGTSGRAEEYYKPTRKVVFIPLEVEFHSATDVVYRFAVKGNDKGGNHPTQTIYLDDVNRELYNASVCKVIDAQIKLYENEKKELLENKCNGGRNLRNLDRVSASIQALQLLKITFSQKGQW